MSVIILVWVGLLGATYAAGAADEFSKFEIANSEIHTIQSKVLDRTYELYVKTPKGYDKPENANKTYPVIYLNDGPFTFQVASGVTHLPMNFGKFEKAILVGISHALGENGQASRTRDMTVSKAVGWKNPTGGAATYLEFFQDEAIPYMETNFRADQKRRVLSGQSFGGLFGAWVLLTAPETFNAYILTSPSLWFDDEEMFRLENTYAANHDDLKASVYFATGEFETPGNNTRNDMVGGQNRFVALLESRAYPGLKIQADIIPGGLHETTFPIGFIRGMHWLFYVQE